VQVSGRKAAERQLTIMKRLTHDGDHLCVLGSPINDRTTTAGQIHQGCHRTLGPAFQKSFAPVQNRLLAAAQQFRRASHRLSLVGPHDDQNPEHQTSIFATLPFSLSQCLLFVSAEFDSIFVRCASLELRPPYSFWPQLYPKDFWKTPLVPHPFRFPCRNPSPARACLPSYSQGPSSHLRYQDDDVGSLVYLIRRLPSITCCPAPQ
jgi:hypothetical protein